MSRTRIFLIAMAIATLIGIATTIAGGLLVRREDGTNCAGPCVTYSEYGWPLQWRTTAPWHYIQATQAEDCIGCAIWGYNREGFSFGSFATDTLSFGAPVVAVEVAGLGVWWAWRSSRSRRAHLPPAS